MLTSRTSPGRQQAIKERVLNFRKNPIFVGFLCAVLPTSWVMAQSPPPREQPSHIAEQAPADACSKPECPIAIRGTATVTVADLAGKLIALEGKQRDLLLADPNALNGVIENLLLTRQIANEADKSANDPITLARLNQAHDEVYAVVRLNQIRATRITGDFERLSKEYYLANKATFNTPRQEVVRHLLIDTTERTDAEAKLLIEKLHSDLKAMNADDFAIAAVENSDDPSKSTNGGLLTVTEGSTEIDPAFMLATMALTTPGQISPPIKSSFGYHIIQLISDTPAHQQTYEEAKPQILERLKQDARRRVVSEYRSEVTAAELKIFPENARAMIMDPEAAIAEVERQRAILKP